MALLDPHPTLTWTSMGTDEPLDQVTELPGSYWAEIGPHGEKWSWIVRCCDGGVQDIRDAAGALDCADEVSAKAAVAKWSQENLSESMSERLIPVDKTGYVTITMVVRRNKATTYNDASKALKNIDLDEIMFFTAAEGVTPAALHAGANPAHWE